ncbi:MAG: response regulator [Xanthobacteraceae bacterium]
MIPKEPDRISWKPPHLAASSFAAGSCSAGIPGSGEPRCLNCIDFAAFAEARLNVPLLLRQSDQLAARMLVFVSAAILRATTRTDFLSPFEMPVMMVLDHTVVPTVILVVEDEMLLRMRAVDMVEDAGFTPVEAVDADEAVAILESRSDIALLFTDIQMPGSMDGLKLAHAVRKRWPPIKIILVSGQLKLANIDIPADSRFFGKPLEAKKMIAEMQDMIGHA